MLSFGEENSEGIMLSLPHKPPVQSTQLTPLKIKKRNTDKPPSVREVYEKYNYNLVAERLLNPQKMEYEKVSEKSFHIYFWTGDPECHGNRGVIVENDYSIGIAIIEGFVSKKVQCLAYATQEVFLFHTKHPIGNRPIVYLTAESVD